LNVVEVKTTIQKYLHLEEKKLIMLTYPVAMDLLSRRGGEHCRFIVDLNLY